MIQPLRLIALDRLYLALLDLLEKRGAALKSFPYGAFIFTELTELCTKLAALPEVAQGRPYAAELAALDKRHDGFGAACFYLVEAYLSAPDTTPEQRKILLEIRAVLGSLEDLIAGYDAEVKAAKDRKDKIQKLTDALASFPIAGNKTLLDWAQEFCSAGESLGDYLSKRADVKPRTEAGPLRNEVIGVLNQTRRELSRAQKKDPNLPADLDAQIFAYFDQLETKSAEEAAAAKKKEAEKKAQSEASMPAASAAPPVPAPPAGDQAGEP
jgi:hypothetical protein